MAANQSSLSSATSPLDSPFRAWFTPRATERDLAFRERTIRGMIPLELLLLGAAAAALLVNYNNTERREVVYLVLTLAPLLAAVAVSFRKITLAGMLLILPFFISLVVVVSRTGFWSQVTLFVLMLVIPLAAVLLSRRMALISIILICLLYLGLVFWQNANGVTPETIGIILNADLGTNLLTIFSGLIFVIALGTYLLNESDSRLSDLQALVETLEQRVADRTHDLEIAKNEAEEARAAAETANEVKSRFLANMSHELRTPLNAILNFSAFVADGVMGPVNDEQADVLNQSISSGKHLLSLINDVLDITKIEAGMMDLFVQDVDMNATMAASISVAKGLVKDKSLDLITDVEDNLPLTYGDRRRVRQVALNLISNAIKFTHKGHVAIRAYRKDAGVEIVVEDTGIGIAPEDQHLVFESFRQINKHDIDVAGTGLGLPISKHFVELHGGRMWFISEPNKGSTFYVYLPVLTEAEAYALAHTGEAQ